MIWILIYFLNGNATGYVEFTSKEKCQKALVSFREELHVNGWNYTQPMICVKK